MKKLIISLLLAMVLLVGCATDIAITRMVNNGEIRVGMSRESLIQIIGSSSIACLERSFRNEHTYEVWQSQNNVVSTFLFIIEDGKVIEIRQN